MRAPYLAMLAVAAWPAAAEDIARQLDTGARVVSVMADGDLCRRIMTPRAVEFLNKKDPKDASVCDLNLWMPVPGDPPRIQVLIRTVNEMSQFWSFNALHQQPEMQKVLSKGERVTVTRKPGFIQ